MFEFLKRWAAEQKLKRKTAFAKQKRKCDALKRLAKRSLKVEAALGYEALFKAQAHHAMFDAALDLERKRKQRYVV
jgi:hypothetical protein